MVFLFGIFEYFSYIYINVKNMADFSKQWADIYDSEFPWDFDIEVEAETIPKGYYKPIICEGFGFIAIEVDMNDKIYLIFDAGNDGIDRIEYKEFIEKEKQKNA